MNRIIAREERHLEVAQLEEKIKIGVMGIGRGAGCTFVSTALAYMLAGEVKKNVGFVQLDGRCDHDIYDALGMDKRFAGREFIDFYEIAASHGKIRELKNIDEHINWAVIMPKQNRKPTLGEALRLLENISCGVLICDLGSELTDDPVQRQIRSELIFSVDALVCVIDPLPSKLLGGTDELSLAKACALKRDNVIWILNKYNDGVNAKELRAFLRLKDTQRIPYIDARHFYCAQYNCRIPISMREIATVAQPRFLSVTECLHHILTDL